MNENHANDGATKNRSPFVAGILGILSPGLGLLYVGKGRMALLTPIFMLLLIAILSWSRLILLPVGYWLLIVGLIVFVVGAIVVACRYAGMATAAPKQCYQRWYIYILFIVVVQAGFMVMEGNSRSTIFGFETHRIPSGSMQPILVAGDFILADSWAYASQSVEVGDVVTFDYPSRPSQVWIKRVIGLPGDQIEIVNGVVTVSGVKLDEPYIDMDNNLTTANSSYSTVVPQGQYFVLGDNRDNSADSRIWGFVPHENIRAKLVNIWFALDKNGIQFERIGLVN
ncbi:MAG: signal peptidase I [Cellvibrionaceae bacterium]|jgi:signal peptidase I